MKQDLLQLPTEAGCYPCSLLSCLLLTETFYPEPRPTRRSRTASSPTLLLLPAKQVRSTSATVATLLLTPMPLATGAQGVCWSTAPTPTVQNARLLLTPTNAAATTLLTGLRPNTTYYGRAYITGCNGLTTYSNQISFTTPALPVPTARVLLRSVYAQL